MFMTVESDLSINPKYMADDTTTIGKAAWESLLPCVTAWLVLVLWLNRSASVNVTFRERNVKSPVTEGCWCQSANFGQAINWKTFSPRASFFVSKTKESEMKTRSPDYVAEC